MKRTIAAELVNWKDSPLRVPLLLRGPRQVGKSFAVEEFGRQNFGNIAIANFEYQPELTRCFSSLDPMQIVARLETLLNQPIRAGQTLLFLDEIQACPPAITALRYFKEKLPELHVIAAGSLLEFLLREADLAFPVGRVQFMYLRPLSFVEFLDAMGEERLIDVVRSVTLHQPCDDVVHGRALSFVRHYFFTGGMPAVVEAFRARRSYRDAQQVQAGLLQTYRSDFGKYARRRKELTNLQRMFERAPALVGEHFKFAKVDPEIRSRDLRVALDQLNWAGLVHVIHATAASGLPLEAQAKDSIFKLLWLDIGLLQQALQIDPRDLLEKDFLQINAGALAEQFVGQEILANAGCYDDRRLHFWERDKKSSGAKVDYVVSARGQVIGLEVKAGSTGRLRSLQQFMTEKKTPIGVRVSQQALGLQRGVLSLPFYLMSELERLLDEAWKQQSA